MGFENLVELCRGRKSAKIVVAGAAALEVLNAVRQAADEGLVCAVLVGNEDAIRSLAQKNGVSLDGFEIIGVGSDREGAELASRMVRDGKVRMLMKGRVPTSMLMHEFLKQGLKPKDGILSHVTLLDVPTIDRQVLITDAALTPYPTMEQRVKIIKNAVDSMRALGVSRPKVALLSASEEVNEKIPFSVEAAKIARMNEPGGPLADYGVIAGPLDFGSAMHAHTASVKGVAGEVAGRPDILVTPDIISGNLLVKSLLYVAGGEVAACVVGGVVPIGMVSRASPARDLYHTLVMSLACS